MQSNWKVNVGLKPIETLRNLNKCESEHVCSFSFSFLRNFQSRQVFEAKAYLNKYI